MSDYTLPIKKRTRATQDQAYKDYFEKKKKKEDDVGDSARVIQPTGGKLLDDSKKLGSCSRMDSESDGGEESSVQIIGVAAQGVGDGDSSDSCPGESAGLKNGDKSKLGFGKIENVSPIDVEDTDHELVFVEKEGEGGGAIGCMNLKKSEGAGDYVSEHDNEGSSNEAQTLSSEEESSYSDDGEDFEPEKSLSYGCLEHLNSLGGDVRKGSGEVATTIIDYSLPIARRTRAGVDQAYKDYFDKKKKEKKNDVGGSAESKLGSDRLLDESKKMGSRCTTDSEFVFISDYSEEASIEVTGDSVDSCPAESAGSKNGKKSKMSFWETENVVVISDDDVEEDKICTKGEFAPSSCEIGSSGSNVDEYPCGEYGTRGLQIEKQPIFDELQSHDLGFHSHSGSDNHVHEEEGTVWELIPGVKSNMYAHQIEGFEFIWNHIAGGIHLQNVEKTCSPDGGNGCVISHAPGTGRNHLTIVFLQSYMKLYPEVRPLIIAPCSMLLTWEQELKHWKFGTPFHNLNDVPESSGKEDKAATNCMKRESQSGVLDKLMLKLHSWKKETSILGISYGLFEKLCGEHHGTSGASKKVEIIRKMLLEKPDVVVFDEGHSPCNHQSYMWMAVSQIKTKRRILLSGTSFQDNFLEFSNTICVVRPELGYSIKSTYCEDFSKDQGRKSFADDNTKLATEFRAKVAPFVHTYRGSILQECLPGLKKYLVTLQPTPLQESFIRRIQVTRNEPFRYDRLEAEISVHPSIMLKEVMFSDDRDILEEVQSNPGAGVKAKFVMELVRLSDALNERVLVFSQYNDPLTITKDLLKSQFQWTEGTEILYMDGQSDAKQQQFTMKVFNDPSSKAKVLLASTKNSNEGINLVGASRVVLLDVSWNPSVKRQAVCHAYGLGQKNLVYIYHLILARTKEEEKHTGQAEKHRLSDLVFSCSDRYGDGKKIPETVSEDKVLEEMVQHEKLKYIFKRIAVPDEDNLKA